MSAAARLAAVDLGATSGRVLRAEVGRDALELVEVHRFANRPRQRSTGLHWDVAEIVTHVLTGLRAAGPVESVGVDAWAVDYGLLRDGVLVNDPYCYRDARTERGVAAVHAVVPPDELYARSGVQHLPFNTVFQLATEPDVRSGDQLALLPDLIVHRLTGTLVAERTNASTTGLLDPYTGEWNEALIERLGYPPTLFPALADPGTPVGPSAAAEGAIVHTVCSHDTASAVLGVPAREPAFAFVSCGTWGLVGVELDAPVITEAGRLANFTNERGIDGTVRYLHNVAGLWLLDETLREWDVPLADALAGAREVRTGGPVFDADDPVFIPPGDMPARIARWLGDRDLPVPTTRPALVRCILESLAAAFARGVRQAAELTGHHVEVVHIVGGGARNELLCQLTADAVGLPVVAGPVEATAIGNALVQARALGAIDGDRWALRALVAGSQATRRFG